MILPKLLPKNYVPCPVAHNSVARNLNKQSVLRLKRNPFYKSEELSTECAQLVCRGGNQA